MWGGADAGLRLRLLFGAARELGGESHVKVVPQRLEYQLPAELVPGALDVPAPTRRAPATVLSPRAIVRLADGDIGYCVQPPRSDECFRATIATAIQVPIELVPDPRLDLRLENGDGPERINRESWVQLAKWLDGRGLRIVFHETVPADRERWIGVCVATPDQRNQWRELSGFDSPFLDHCLNFHYDDIVFDPAISLKPPPEQRLRAYRPSEVTYGISFDPKE